VIRGAAGRCLHSPAARRPWVSENGELCTCDVTEPLGQSQPTISHHFRKLTEAGLVTGERRGTWTYYRMVPRALAALAAV
jgi:ArsR family transcriptional regulator